MTLIKTLGEVLASIGALPWDFALYLPAGGAWDESTSCAVLDPDDVEADEDLPAVAKDHGLRYALDVATVQDVVTNAKEQSPSINSSGLVNALSYYYKNDAFISLG